MKRLISILLFLFLIFNAEAQKVFSTQHSYQADIKVYVVDKEYQADKKIYFVDRQYQADLIVYFTDKAYKAGWKKNQKKQLLYRALLRGRI